MTDVFIRVFSSSELRLGFAIATVARWKMQGDVRVTVLQWLLASGSRPAFDFGCKTFSLCNSDPPFATSSLREAEGLAQSDPYIICNDDNLPYGQDFVSKGLGIMQRNPEYGCVSGVVVNGDPYKMDGPEITEIHAVGGLVFLRKGLVTEFPAIEDPFWDGERHRQVIAKGFKSGYARDLPYLHMGAKFSIASPAWFTGA